MSTLPNPDTYLNHLPPAQAAQFEAARNLSLAVLGAMIWDILIYIPADYKILRRSPFRLVTVCFITSRLFALTFVLLAVIEFTHPISHCNAMNYCIGVGCVLTIASTTLIFLQRLRAVYTGNRYVKIIAILLWIGTVITMAFTVVDAKSLHIPGTRYCVYAVIDRPLLANGVVFLVFDTFVFLATSYKIASSHLYAEDGAPARLEAAISGKALPRLSRAVLRGGQEYYLITLCLQVPVLVLTAIPSVSANLKLMLTFPLGCLAASMACRIFRNMKLEDSQRLELLPQTSLSTVNFTPASRLRGTVTNPHSQAHLGSRSLDYTVSVSYPQRKASSTTPSSPDDVPPQAQGWNSK
ncbi:hypothetical protein AN958_02337 [Leucoagaricus sp. SymC.cos]|nr:hypothetical protein AN958_02337 [Leucoagaricus sp. SymC.cos]